MSGGGDKSAKVRVYKPKKVAYFAKLIELFDSYPRILLFTCDNVGSKHLQEIRRELRKNGDIMLLGKNTMIRKALRGHAVNNPAAEALIPNIWGNVGMIYTKREISDVNKLVQANRKPAPARAGSVAPVEVIIPAQLTSLDPSKTSFFQQLQIPTKINKGTIEITKDVPLISVGQKVGPTEASLCQMLNITPFSYGLVSVGFFEGGSFFPANVLGISESDMIASFQKAVANVKCVSLATNIPTVAAVPNGLLQGYKNMLSIAVETNISFKQADKIKEYLKNPTAFAAAAPVAAAVSTPAESKKEEKGGKKEEKKKVEEEKKEESDEDMGLGLFD